MMRINSTLFDSIDVMILSHGFTHTHNEDGFRHHYYNDMYLIIVDVSNCDIECSLVPVVKISDVNIKSIFVVNIPLRQSGVVNYEDFLKTLNSHMIELDSILINKKISFDRDISYLNDNSMQELALKLEKLRDLRPDLSNCIQSSYLGNNITFKEKRMVEMFLKDYFRAYIFDEGIHPEFIPPDYIPTKKGVITKFRKFIGDKLL